MSPASVPVPGPLPGPQSSGRFRARRAVAAVSATLLGVWMVVVVSSLAHAAAGCQVTYTANNWPGGFTANIGITNLGDPINNGWKLTWTYAGDQKVTQAWNGTVSQSGQAVTLSSASWNASLGTNASVYPGVQGSYSGTNVDPTSFALNGVTCTGTPVPTTSTPVPTTTTPVPTTTTPVPTTTTPVPTTSTPQPGTHLDNPYVGAKPYVNPDWSKRAAAEPGGSRVSNQPTGIWLDSIASITAPAGSGYTTGVRQHLDNALAQGANLVQFVIYDLPGRDCAALASNGELGPTEIGRYKTDYIDPIAAIEADAKYASIRIVNIVEIDSLPNLITNAGGTAGSTDMCATMKANGNYVTGIQYALSKLHAAGTNTYQYIDAAHHGWIGWSSNFGPAADLFHSTAAGATGGVNTVDGFITDTANYSALTEPFLKVTSTVNGQSVRASSWVDWNDYVDELTFAQAFRQKLISVGFNSTIGMLIDTSRNGWGGPNRPAAASTSTDLNTWVDQSRIDKRPNTGDWCNQSGAGIGERPQAAPAAGIDAYVWIKPPGESDGSSSLIPTGPNNPAGKGFDQMCDPTYQGNPRNNNKPSGALPNAPISGAWFSAQFQQLMANAYPPLG